MRVPTPVFAVLSLLAPCIGGAQAPATLAPATRIRYALPPGKATVIANVVAQRGDSLWVRPVERADTVALALPNLARLEVSRGTENHVLLFAAVGLVAGAMDGRGDLPGNGHLIFGAVGAGVGALFGWITRRERWEPVPTRAAAAGEPSPRGR
jgi:hypothetical protein